MGVIKDIWDNELWVVEDIYEETPEVKYLDDQEIVLIHDIGKLIGSDNILLAELNTCYRVSVRTMGKLAFEKGFRLGAQMILDIYGRQGLDEGSDSDE